MFLKKIAFIFLSVNALNLAAQAFTPDYIQSLPPEVQADVLQNIASTPEVDPAIYRGPQTDVRMVDSYSHK